MDCDNGRMSLEMVLDDVILDLSLAIVVGTCWMDTKRGTMKEVGLLMVVNRLSSEIVVAVEMQTERVGQVL